MLKRILALIICFLGVVSNFADVVINEIHYDPDVKTELVEFIELYNTAATPVDLAGWSFTSAVDYTFPAGATIPANGYQVVCQNPTHFAAKFGKTALGPWTGSLKNEGDEIVLRDRTGVVVDRVNYRLGFPWPTVGYPPGYSIELANPNFDNDLGGNWRTSGSSAPAASVTLIPASSNWKYFKGLSEPSSPTNAWRSLAFNDSSWLSAAAPIGYDSDTNFMNSFGARLSDMSGNYSTVYFRKTFTVADPTAFSSMQLQALYDDGFKVWINGSLVLNASMPTTAEVSYNELATTLRESNNYDTFNLPAPSSYLVAGQNIIAIQAANILLSGSSDFFLDLVLTGSSSGSTGPTPFARNNNFTTNLPPAIRQVDHSPNQPKAGEAVVVTAKVTDPEGVASVQLQYQIVDPGNYIELTDAAYATSWTAVAMNDSGTGGDALSGDSVYTATLPGSLQVNRRLVRYRIVATDATGKAITAPYSDDPQPNFAYFCYNGVPSWSGAISPGSSDPTLSAVVTYPSNVLTRLPVYHLISKKTSVETSTWIERYSGDLYKWAGTLVYDGKVYDHIHYRARGGVWRYAMGKNMWKFDFNRGHDFEAKNNWGQKYDVGWTKLNLGACIQQGDYLHRGEQGMFESIGFRLFNLVGLEAPRTHFIQFRVIDEPAEATASQYTNDFWGLYLAVEQEDSRFLQFHNMPDSNFYKMEGGTGTLNNEGQFGPSDKSDLNYFLSTLRSSPSESWWRSSFDLMRYYSYRTIVEGIHHYDIDGDPGKNYFYYTNGVSGKWEVHPWDLDLTWADNMYGGGGEQFRDRVLPQPNFNREYKNQIREIRDLLFNTDEAYKLIDEYAAMIYTNGGPSMVGADRAMWDYNPIMTSSYVNSSKAGAGRFYQAASTKDFPGMLQLMKNYVVQRGSYLDSLASDAGLPNKPTISNVSPAGNPANRLSFKTSAYSGGSPFAAMQWRLGEITPVSAPVYDPNKPRVYEIEPVWQSDELATFNDTIAVPSGATKVGHTYRARVKVKDSAGRWSNWSAPIEFIAGEADNVAALWDNLRVSELMFNPPLGNDYEFVELYNASTNMALNLAGVKFTSGIDYTFPAGATLAPHAYCLVVRAPALNDFAVFRNYYGLSGATAIYGPYSGSLSNDGEELTIKTAASGTTIVDFTYGDSHLWPVAADGAGHSIVPRFFSYSQSLGDFSYPGNWRASAFIKGSPGQADPEPVPGPVLNEVMANTTYSNPNNPGYDSNDWIEILNPQSNAINWTDWYLSDDPANLKKWAIPGTLPANSRVVFDEVTGFHSPITNGFGLDQTGESVLLSYLPASGQARVADAVKFKGQSATNSWSRVPDGYGPWRPAAPTRNAPNGAPVQSVLITEVMYHPATNTASVDNTLDEYVEIYNGAASVVTFADNGVGWRIDGGVSFQFPTNTTLSAGSFLVLVNFDPVALPATASAFRTKFHVPSGVPLYGPFAGKLSNDSDRVALERPQLPAVVGDPYAWVIVDEVTYGKNPFWSLGADASGASLHRVFGTYGNDPTSWFGSAPDPGQPTEDGSPRLAIALNNGALSIRAYLTAGNTCYLERTDDLSSNQWQTISAIDAPPTGWKDLTDPAPFATARFYRLRFK